MLSYRHHVTDKVLSWRPKHTTMDTNRVRKAQALIDEARHRGHNIPQLVEAARLLQAELDAAPKVFTDEEIERIAQHVWTAQGWDGEVGCAEGNLLIAGLRYARDNYLSTGLTVEEVMDIAKEEVFEWWNGERVFHARLTAAIKAKR